MFTIAMYLLLIVVDFRLLIKPFKSMILLMHRCNIVRDVRLVITYINNKFGWTFQYLTKKLGADPIVFGYLQTTFAVVQLAGGPLFGRFGDIFGGQAAMTLAFMAAALSYGLLGLSYTLPILFISRLPSVFMHAMQGTAYILVKCKSALFSSVAVVLE